MISTTVLLERSRLVTKVRQFFLERNYVELDTPLLSPAPLPESCLEVFETEYVNPFYGNRKLWLLPSPEVWIKKFIAEEKRNVFELCKAFRNAESIGTIHSPEFTMLEYYTVNATARDSIEITEALFDTCSTGDTPHYAKPPFRIMTMQEAWLEFAQLDLIKLQDRDTLREALLGKGLIVNKEASWEDLFNQAFVQWIEPELPKDRPLVLIEYPAQIECLARNISGTPWKDRWELYINGIELLNCYTEAATKEAVLASMKKEAEKKQNQQVPHAVNFEYAELFDDFPLCSGVAMGFERFIMAMNGLADIRSVLPFPYMHDWYAEKT